MGSFLSQISPFLEFIPLQRKKTDIVSVKIRLFTSGSANRRFQSYKRAQLFVGVHNKAPSVVAMCVGNPDRSPLTINGWDPAQAPTGFAEIVSDDFPVLQNEAS